MRVQVRSREKKILHYAVLFHLLTAKNIGKQIAKRGAGPSGNSGTFGSLQSASILDSPMQEYELDLVALTSY